MVTQIGLTAGEILHYLDKHGIVKPEEITASIEKPKELVLMSLGWLARENHILITEEKKQYFVTLKEKAQEITE